jgi:hypothetical protein
MRHAPGRFSRITWYTYWSVIQSFTPFLCALVSIKLAVCAEKVRIRSSQQIWLALAMTSTDAQTHGIE